MTSKQPEQNRLDEQSISEAAAAALSDLQIDAEAKSVSVSKDKWCIQFTADYNQFCDSFRDRFGKENSFELIREKIKRHILKQQQNKIRSSVRIRRGKPQQQQRQASSDNLLETAVKAIESVASQTAGIAGEVINQASSLPETVLTTLDNASKAVSEISAPMGQSVREAKQPLVRLTVKAAAGKATKKSSRSVSKGSSKKGGPAKKAASKRKPAASKSASKPAQKKSRSSKKSTSKKSTTKKSASKKSAK